MTSKSPATTPLFTDIKSLIDSARRRAAVAVNAELTLLYWQVGNRIQSEVLKGERAAYGKQVVQTLAKQLTKIYGKGWSQKQLHHCLRTAETIKLEQFLLELGAGFTFVARQNTNKRLIRKGRHQKL